MRHVRCGWGERRQTRMARHKDEMKMIYEEGGARTAKERLQEDGVRRTGLG